MSYRIWWLIAFCALGIGLSIETGPPADTRAAEHSAAPATTATVATKSAQAAGGPS